MARAAPAARSHGWRPQAMAGTGLMPFDSSYTSPLLRNTVAAIHLLLDCAPTYVVCTAALCRREGLNANL